MAERRAGTRTGRRPGDSGTRTAIQEAARRQFAEQGYDRTSMRSVAGEAGVDPTLVSHFFGTKQDLFAAVVRLPVDPAAVIPQVLAGDRDQIGARLAAVVVAVLEAPEGAARLTGLVRAAASEPEAARVVRDLVTADILTPLARGLGMDEPELRGALTAAQVVGLLMARHVVQVEPLPGLDADRLARLVAPVLQHYLAEPLDSSPAGR